MRYLLIFVLIVLTCTLHAQTFSPLSSAGFVPYHSFNSLANYKDSVAAKKWFVTSYTGVSTGLVFYKGGNASYFAPVAALQLNRRLTDNLYAFANVTAAPAYINFNGIGEGTNLSKVNGNTNFSRTGNLNISSSVNFGLMYVNDAKTFSISGSIGVERSSYPVIPYNQQSTRNQSPAVHTYR